VRDLHDLLTAAHIAPPYLLVGQSGGGFDVYHYTGRYHGDVVGLVLLDVPAGQATMSAADVAELAWDKPRQPGARGLRDRRTADGAAPAADPGDTGHCGHSQGGPVRGPPGRTAGVAEGQLTPGSGGTGRGHNIDQDDPSGVLAEIEKVLALVS
jgi:pimeloyl-ACP methyl ester carboxylesterase